MRRLLAAVALAGAALAPQTTPSAEPLSAPGALEAVIGLSVRGIHRAYPTALFAQRRVVNDVVGGIEVAVFHDAELGLSTAWFRTVLGEPIEFSGTAAGTVVDDVTTVTRWDLATGTAVGGNLQGQHLVPLAAARTTWAGWVALHKDAQRFSGSP